MAISTTLETVSVFIVSVVIYIIKIKIYMVKELMKVCNYNNFEPGFREDSSVTNRRVSPTKMSLTPIEHILS
jgi:hypothetical protein